MFGLSMNKQKLMLLELAKNCPCNEAVLKQATLHFNPGCGDSIASCLINHQVEVFVEGCIICKAATNYVLKKYSELANNDQKLFLESFQNLILTGNTDYLTNDPYGNLFKSINKYPERYRCALLITNSLKELDEKK